MSINPDLIYRKSRADLIQYEDARFRGLIGDVPNFYISRNDQTLYGDILRAVSQEMAWLEYLATYNLVNKDPQYLTPPDIKRRWAGPLQISSDYPSSLQGDLDYKLMLRQLLLAYKQGTTLAGVTGVINAYANAPVTIVELYKLVRAGDPGFDFSDRNSIQVSVNADTVTTLDELQNLTADLYNAIALAKPAHVGIDFSIVFSEAEDLDALISEMTDNLTITFMFEDTGDTSQMLTLEPYTEGEVPTQLAAYGQVVGTMFANSLTTAQWTALQYPAFQTEYVGPNAAANYILNPTCYLDVALTQGAPATPAEYAALTPTEQAAYTLANDGNYYQYSGVISKARGLLAPHIDSTWEVSGGDALLGLDFD